MKIVVQILLGIVVVGSVSLSATAQRPRTVTRTAADKPWMHVVPDPDSSGWTAKDGIRPGYAYQGLLPKHQPFYDYIRQKRESDLPLTWAEEAFVRHLITIRRWPDPPAPNPFWAAFMRYLREQSISQLSTGEIILLDQLIARGLVIGELPLDPNIRRVSEYLNSPPFRIRNWFERTSLLNEPFVDDLNSGWGYDLPYDAPYDPAITDEMARRVIETLRQFNDPESVYGRELAKMEKALSAGEAEWEAYVAIRQKEFREDKSSDFQSYRQLDRAITAGGKIWHSYVESHLEGDSDESVSEEMSVAPLQPSTDNEDINVKQLRNEAEAHCEKHEYTEAVFDFTRAIDADRNSAAAYAGRALAKAELNDVDGASRDVFHALELDDGCALAYRVRSMIKRALDDPVGALADANRAVTLAPNDYQVYLTRGLAFEAMKDYGAAAFDYSFVIYRSPEYALAFLRRGFARLQLDQNEDAIADFDRFIKTDSNNSMAFAYRGLAKERTGNIAGAIADYKHAVLIDPREGLANRGLARLTP